MASHGRRTRAFMLALVGTLALMGVAMGAEAQTASSGGKTTRISVSSAGAQGNEDSSFTSSMSADGRYVAFTSGASNLVAGDSTNYQDVFVRDRRSGTTERVNVSSSGAVGSAPGERPSISADGRYVAFDSSASNLVAGDTERDRDVFVRDRLSRTTEWVSVPSSGAQGNGGSSLSPSVSADGRYVAFSSGASNVVAGDTNGFDDVFVRDRRSGTTERVSVSSSGAQGNNSSSTPSMSADGRYVAFPSFASNLVAGDTNRAKDVFMHKRG